MLIVEDDWFDATRLAEAIVSGGAEVLGPAATLAEVFDILHIQKNVDVAVVNVGSADEKGIAIADTLRVRGIPFLLTVAQEIAGLPDSYEDAARCHKPYDVADVAVTLAKLVRADPNARIPASRLKFLRNRLLASFDRRDFNDIINEAELVNLPLNSSLAGAETIDDPCYFILSGIASVRMVDASGAVLDIAMVGREGVAGSVRWLKALPFAMHVVVQVPGNAAKVSANVVASIAGRGRGSAVLESFAQDLTEQMARNALYAARYPIEQRVARHLLMLADRLDGFTIPVTHEALASTLGARRAEVTVALHALELGRYVISRRAAIDILDRDGLIGCAKGCYESVRGC